MSWVIEHSQHKGSAFVVLLMIANHAHADGTGAWPNLETLARESRITTRQVSTILGILERSRELVVQRGKGPRGSNLYSLPMHQHRQPLEKISSGKVRQSSTGNPQPETSTEPSLTVLEENRQAARIDQAKIQGAEPPDAAENPVQPLLFNEAKNKAKNKQRPTPAWVKGELAEDLWRGIHHQKIEATFFDARHLSPHEQLAECVRTAVTGLVLARVARLRVLRADEIERRAFEELLPGVSTLELVRDFDARRRHTMQAVTRGVIDVCAQMLDQVNGGYKNGGPRFEAVEMRVTEESCRVGAE